MGSPRQLIAIGLAAVLLLAGCSSPQGKPPAMDMRRSKVAFAQVGIDEVRRGGAGPLVDAATRIGAELVSSERSGAGSVVSPWAAVSLLAELRDAARGSTAKQLDDVGFGAVRRDDGSDLDRTMAAFIGQVEQWAGDPGTVSASTPPATPLFQVGRAVLVPSLDAVSDHYLDTLSKYYDTGVYPVDLGAPMLGTALGEWAAVNSASTWTSTPLEPGAGDRFAMLATAYLAAAWRYPFEVADTTNAPFTDSDGTTSNVPTMHGTSTARLVRAPGFDAVQLDYGTTLALQIVLPPRGRPLSDVTTPESFTAARLALAAAPAAQHRISLPRWRTSTWIRLPGPLAVRDAFSAGASLDALGPRARISDARLAAALTVGERGTVIGEPDASGSATPAPAPATGPEPDPVSVDRAFAYSVVDTATGLPLLMGSVRSPVLE
ncbi:serpin family protein [Tsukamurella sp. 8F]|uniref:serpin family protein n=1 Tax=unclassified Tsukamurella TaxID=2633480 RepID=UPI0023B9CCE5|nr:MULTISPECIES: serpin family protein [unclassified Tsukamurella]MDF0532481.1 serpin family protein [Tsukamurella sp. 8J]MDF0589318.1 serpin family protein [Tsukamurella sp. 8F]